MPLENKKKREEKRKGNPTQLSPEQGPPEFPSCLK